MKEHEQKKITLFDTYCLGIRNTFNIVSKFLLLFLVFAFMISAFLLEYANFKKYENEEKEKYVGINFKDVSEDRLLVKKQDKTAFSDEEYAKMANKNNIKYIVKNDWFIDKNIKLYSGKNIGTKIGDEILYNYDIEISGNVWNIENFDGKIDVGRMPENEDEAIIKISRNNQYIKENRINEILTLTLNVGIQKPSLGEYDISQTIKIVGVEYIDNGEITKIYMNSNFTDNLLPQINEINSKVSYFFANHYINENFKIVPSKNVEKGFAVVKDELKYQLTKENIIKQPITIYVDNIYYEEELELEISNTYTEKNFKKITGSEEYQNAIYINEDDYNKLFRKPFYQSSVYVQDIENIDSTISELQSMGLNVKKVSDYRVQSNEMKKNESIISIMKVIVTVITCATLFFISYFVITLILKSRNTYYTTLRMLGMQYKSLRRVLEIELLSIASFAYIIILFLIILIKTNILNIKNILQLMLALDNIEILLIYLVVVLIVKLLARRIAKKTFSKTIVNAYNGGE